MRYFIFELTAYFKQLDVHLIKSIKSKQLTTSAKNP